MHRIKAMTGAKRRAWEAFSKYIRMRDSLATTGGTDYCRCFTCHKVVPFDGNLHAGHAIGGRSAGILFDEDLVHGQCRTCNVEHGGEYEIAKHYLVQEHGVAWFEAKNRHAKEPCFASEKTYDLIAKIYREKLKQLREVI